MMTGMTRWVLTSAGGNPTAIAFLSELLERHAYEAGSEGLWRDAAADLRAAESQLEVEQAGYIIPSASHFEMAGGEFCGNGVLSAAMLMAQAHRSESVTFTASGLTEPIQAVVKFVSKYVAQVSCEMQMGALPETFGRSSLGPLELTIVDLESMGITHLICQTPFPGPKPAREALEAALDSLDYRATKPAVGMIWTKETDDGVAIEPLVWVRAEGTMIHETACGSGSLAAALAHKGKGARCSVVQPTGYSIDVTIDDHRVVQSSEIRIVSEAT